MSYPRNLSVCRSRRLAPLATPSASRCAAAFRLFAALAAEECGTRAICVILSGTGADGSLGLKVIKEKGGFVIAQDPGEAGYDGMPRSAIMTGAVDLVLPVAKIPGALVKYNRRMALTRTQNSLRPQDTARDWLPEIIDLLRMKTAHDFALYKQGTLRRRIERRMAMAAIETDDMDRYFEILRSDTNELDILAKDLLINVTSFFRDPRCSISWRRRSFQTSSAGSCLITPSASGLLGAARAKRPIP